MQKLRRIYVACAIMLLNLLLAAGAALLAVAGWKAASRWFKPDLSPVERRYGDRVFAAYPGVSTNALRRMLAETWSRSYVFEPFTHFKESPFAGDWVNVSSNGFRLVPGQGPWPPDRSSFNVFLFGGSTLFGYGVPDEATIAAHLQAELRRDSSARICVYNFGRGHYFSTQELILFIRLLAEGFVPDVAIFLDGLNDFYRLDGEPSFSDRFRKCMEGRDRRRRGTEAAKRRSAGDEDAASLRPLLEGVIARYQANQRIERAIGRAFGARTLFVWQPVPTYQYDLGYHLFAGEGFAKHRAVMAGYPLMAERRAALEREGDFVWLADIQHGLKQALYVDAVHYNSEMGRIIAVRIAKEIVLRGWLETRTNRVPAQQGHD